MISLREDEAWTIAFGVSMQNSELATGVALTMGRVAIMGFAPAVFSSLQNITGLVLATWWRSKKIVTGIGEKVLLVKQEKAI